MAAHNTRFSCDTSVSSRLDRGAIGRLGLVEHVQRGGDVRDDLQQSAIDAVALAELGQRFTAQQITNPEGYQGVNGLFRFRPNGLIERGLSILEVTPNGPKVIAPPPARFAAGY